MNVFLTGATGFIGSAVVRELSAAGHQVTGLLRSPDKTDRLAALGGRPAYGDLAVPATWGSLARNYDALVHLGFSYDDPAGTDRTAVDALLEAATTGETGRIVVYTSGCWVLGDTGGESADESASTERPAEVVSWRPAHEELVLDAGGSFATAVIRPGMVYGGHGALTGRLFESARDEGASEYIPDGQQHWSMVYREDLARLYRRVVEEEAEGIFHGVDGRPVKVKEAARAASEAAGANGETRPLSMEAARESLGPVADALALDQRLDGVRSRELGWRPERTSFPDAAADAFREWEEAAAG